MDFIYKFVDLKDGISAAFKGSQVYVVDFASMSVNEIIELTVAELQMIDNSDCICVIREMRKDV